MLPHHTYTSFIPTYLPTYTLGFVAHVAGLLVWWASPFISFTGIDYYAGRGDSIYVAAGGAVLGRSPSIGYEGLANQNRHDFWIQVIAVI